MSDTPSSAAFRELGISEALAQAVSALGYEEPTPIQREAIPPLLAGRDVLGQAATGTGKTAAFALPLLTRLGGPGDVAPRALILVPTRELAMQVAEALHKYGRGIGIRETPIFGGQAIDRQLRALKRGVDVVVATPGRALDHIRRKTLSLKSIQTVVLDEADEMLDMGFAEDLEAILEATPKEKQTALFSATMPPRIAAIASKHLKDPVRLRIEPERAVQGTAPKVRHTGYVVARPQKLAALARILDVERPPSALVFCRTRIEVDELTEALTARGYQADALHGGLSQEQRDRVMRRFRDGTSDLLVATDVAARGLDVERLTHVVNYDVPSAPDIYTHRIGRTGRAGREGTAITLVEPREHRLLRNIEHATRQKIELSSVPTVADLRARQLELTRASLSEILSGGNLERYRVVVDSLATEHDVVEIAMAAVKLAHIAEGGEKEEPEIAPVTLPQGKGKGAAMGMAKGKGVKSGGFAKGKGGKREKPEWDVGRLFVGAGRKDGVRPGDLVGAIVNETGLTPRAIGAIEIADGYSLVELPNDVIDDVIPVLRKAKLKGKKVVVKRDGERA